MKKFFCVCFSSTLQRTIVFPKVQLEKVNRSEYYRIDASGKAVNSARILAQLEKDCVFTFCPLGENNFEDFVRLAEKDNLNLSFTTIPGNTRECWTLLDKNAGTTTELVVGEPVFSRTEDFVEQECKLLNEVLPEMIGKVDAVLLAGSRPGVWRDDAYAVVVKKSLDEGKIVLADFHGKDLLNTLEVCTPSIIKINEEEFLETFGDFTQKIYEEYDSDGKSGLSDEELLKLAVVKKSEELQNIIVVTRGTKSSFGADKGIFAECPVEKVVAVNTTACGDSFNSGFLYEYVNSGDFEAALKKGTWCAARNAELECPGAIAEL
ncbi:MAG: PfkB family carbohydrate kinase [Treponema sp.]|nr:PfkB family carbohydrate kinase [Treponema sp.]